MIQKLKNSNFIDLKKRLKRNLWKPSENLKYFESVHINPEFFSVFNNVRPAEAGTQLIRHHAQTVISNSRKLKNRQP